MKLHTHVYNKNERGGPWWKTAQWSVGATIRETYHGTLAKGWWSLGKSSITNYFEAGVALGGEDNMAQAEIVLPFLGRGAIGVRIPRSWTKGLIYHRREWSVRIGYVGRWFELMIASDEHMRDTGMVSYYREKRDQPADCGNCNHYAAFHTDLVRVSPASVRSLDDVEKLTKVIPNPERRCITHSEVNHGSAPCACPGYVAKAPTWSRVALWPGWHLTVQPRLKDRVLGRMICTTTEGETEPVIVPMPEGNYPGTVKPERRVWKRQRWPWPSQVRTSYAIDMQIAVPVPGKGENSWDCEDDGIYGTGGNTPAEAVANVTKAALRSRSQYAGPNWVPDAGWPEGIGSRAA